MKEMLGGNHISFESAYYWLKGTKSQWFRQTNHGQLNMGKYVIGNDPFWAAFCKAFSCSSPHNNEVLDVRICDLQETVTVYCIKMTEFLHPTGKWWFGSLVPRNIGYHTDLFSKLSCHFFCKYVVVKTPQSLLVIFIF